MTARPSRFSSSRRAAGALVALAALVTACESKLPTSAEIEELDAAKAVAQPTVLALTEQGKTAYLIDGKAATELEARAVAANRISGLRVARKPGSDDTEIRILTKEAAERDGIKTEGGGGVMLRTRSSVDTGGRVMLRSDASNGSSPRRKFDGLLIIDGKVAPASELNTLAPERIESVEVVKSETAKARYSDPRAVNGVILVTTKSKP